MVDHLFSPVFEAATKEMTCGHQVRWGGGSSLQSRLSVHHPGRKVAASSQLHSRVCNQMCINCTVVSQARPHKSVNTQLVPHAAFTIHSRFKPDRVHTLPSQTPNAFRFQTGTRTILHAQSCCPLLSGRRSLLPASAAAGWRVRQSNTKWTIAAPSAGSASYGEGHAARGRQARPRGRAGL